MFFNLFIESMSSSLKKQTWNIPMELQGKVRIELV